MLPLGVVAALAAPLPFFSPTRTFTTIHVSVISQAAAVYALFSVSYGEFVLRCVGGRIARLAVPRAMHAKTERDESD
jgi:hypothetical protein